MVSLSPTDWLQEKLKPLVELATKLEPLSPHYEGHSWSVVKLLILGGWSYVYTTIIPHYFREYWYVDLLAGPGTTRVNETGDVVLGSPFVAHFFARRHFTRYVFVELNEEFCAALRARSAKVLGERVEVLNRDCNELAPRLAEQSKKKRAHLLVFVDNEGLDAQWRAIESLLGTGCDLLINFPASSIKRPLGAARKGDEGDAEALTAFFGDDKWRKASNGNELLELYKKRLASRYKELRKKEAFVSSIRVGSRQFYYDVILVCKQGPYVQAWNYLQKRLEWQDPKIVNYTLDLLGGRTQRIDWLLGLHDVAEKARSEKGERRERMSNASMDYFLSG